MLMNRTRLRALLVAAVTLVCCGTFAASASAYTFANHVKLYSGNHYAGPPYLGAVTAVSAGSHGTAYSGTWINNTTGSGGTRVSADGYCNTPGCIVQIGWSGAKPNGYGTAHNHGNASPSYFSGAIH